MNGISLPQYLIESSFCLGIFYIVYLLLLRKETYFQINRFYLIGTALFSLLVPFLNISLSAPESGQSSIVYQFLPAIDSVQRIHQSVMNSVENPTRFVISIGDVIRIVYWVGVFIMSVKLMDRLFSIFNLISRGVKESMDEGVLVSGLVDIPASSFFSFVFWNKDHESDSKVNDAIMKHELVHVRQWHSLDVIYMELLVIMKWFNPLIYLYRNSLRLTHEYIADQYVSKEIENKVVYANILLSQANVNNRITPLSNTFYSQLKKRIEMLSHKGSGPFSILKLLSTIPIALSMIALFSFDQSERIAPLSTGMAHIESRFDAFESTPLISIKAGALQNDRDNRALNLSWGSVALGLHANQADEILTLQIDVRDVKSLLTFPKIEDYKETAEEYGIEILHFRNGILSGEYNYMNFKELLNDATNIWDRNDKFRLKISPKFEWGEPNFIIDLQVINERIPNIFRWGDIVFTLSSHEKSSFFVTEYLNVLDLLRSIKEQPHFIGEYAHEDDFTFQMRIVGENGKVEKYTIKGGMDFNDFNPNLELEPSTVFIEKLRIKGNTWTMSTSFSFEIGIKESPDPRSVVSETPRWYRSMITNMPGNDIKIGANEIKIHKSFRESYTSKAQRLTKETLKEMLQTHSIKRKENGAWRKVTTDNFEVQIQVSREVARNYLISDKFHFQNFMTSMKLPPGVRRSSRVSQFSLTESIYESMFYDSEDKEKRDALNEWVASLDDGDYLDILINDKADGSGVTTYVSFIISDGYEAFNPTVKLGKKYEGPITESNYQMVYQQDGTILIKVDAKDPKNAKIVNAFSDSNKYTILDIPDYKTDYRILSYKEDLLNREKINVVSKQGMKDLNIHMLMEFRDEEKNQPRLVWGRMVSMPGIGNYSYKEFNRSRKNDIKIKVDNRTLEVKRFDVYIVDKEDQSMAFTTESIRTFDLMQILKDLKPETTIYFDNIIVDDEGDWLHLMDRYALTFE